MKPFYDAEAPFSLSFIPGKRRFLFSKIINNSIFYTGGNFYGTYGEKSEYPKTDLLGGLPRALPCIAIFDRANPANRTGAQSHAHPGVFMRLSVRLALRGFDGFYRAAVAQFIISNAAHARRARDGV